MAHIVTCVYCKEKFDRDKLPFVKVAERRYAHAECAKQNIIQKSQEELDYDALEDYIKKLFKENYVEARIKKQIKDYKAEYNYTYSGMLKTLIWWYDIKGNSIDKANGGIGIIPFVYNDALNYYYNIYLAQILNQNIKNYKAKVNEITIVSPSVDPKNPKLFNLEEENNNEF